MSSVDEPNLRSSVVEFAILERTTLEKLRVATLNIWNKAGPWAERLPLIRKQVIDLSPDVLGLQEVLRLVPDEKPAPATK